MERITPWCVCVCVCVCAQWGKGRGVSGEAGERGVSQTWTILSAQIKCWHFISQTMESSVVLKSGESTPSLPTLFLQV